MRYIKSSGIRKGNLPGSWCTYWSEGGVLVPGACLEKSACLEESLSSLGYAWTLLPDWIEATETEAES